MKEKIFKKGKTKRLFALLLTLCMVFTVTSSLPAYATSSGGDLLTTITPEGATITPAYTVTDRAKLTLSGADEEWKNQKADSDDFDSGFLCKYGKSSSMTIEAESGYSISKVEFTTSAGTLTDTAAPFVLYAKYITSIAESSLNSDFSDPYTGEGAAAARVLNVKVYGHSGDHTYSDGACSICGYENTHTQPGGEGKDEGAGSCPSTPSKSEAPTIPTDYVAERVAEEEAMEVSPVTVDTAQYGAGEAAVVPATSYNLSKFVTTKGIVKGIKTAVEAANNNKKDVAEIYTGKPFCFNKEIIKAIQEGNKTVVYYFAHEGHIYSVTVPATVDAAKVLEQDGFAGPLYVGQQLGTTKLIK